MALVVNKIHILLSIETLNLDSIISIRKQRKMIRVKSRSRFNQLRNKLVQIDSNNISLGAQSFGYKSQSIGPPTSFSLHNSSSNFFPQVDTKNKVLVTRNEKLRDQSCMSNNQSIFSYTSRDNFNNNVVSLFFMMFSFIDTKRRHSRRNPS